MTPKQVSEVLGASYSSTKKLMWTMLGDGQLVKDGKGRYSPANPTTPTDPTTPGNPGNRGNSGNSGNPGNPTLEGYRDAPEGNPTGNPRNADTYGGNGPSVTTVTRVTGVGKNGDCGNPTGNPVGASEEWRDRKALESLRHGPGPRKALEHYETNGTPFEQVVRSVMHDCGRGEDNPDDWEAAVIRAIRAVKRGAA